MAKDKDKIELTLKQVLAAQIMPEYLSLKDDEMKLYYFELVKRFNEFINNEIKALNNTDENENES